MINLFCLFHFREWNSLNCGNGLEGVKQLYSRIEQAAFYLKLEWVRGRDTNSSCSCESQNECGLINVSAFLSLSVHLVRTQLFVT